MFPARQRYRRAFERAVRNLAGLTTRREVAPPLVRRQGISPAIAAEVAALPESFHRDPADRILVATSRVLGATLLTQDRRILDASLTPTLG